MEQLTKNQAVATSQEAVQNQNEPQLRRSEERFSRNAETVLVCCLLLEKKNEDTGHITTFLLRFLLLIIMFLWSYLLQILCFYAYCNHKDLHSFPTRRSSDLKSQIWTLLLKV